MPEVRDTTLIIHIETTFAAMLRDVCKDKITISSYVRQLIIENLKAKGALDDSTITKVIVG